VNIPLKVYINVPVGLHSLFSLSMRSRNAIVDLLKASSNIQSGTNKMADWQTYCLADQWTEAIT